MLDYLLRWKSKRQGNAENAPVQSEEIIDTVRVGNPRRSNWGDVISPFLFERISGRKPRLIRITRGRPKRGSLVLLMVGSVIKSADEKSIVWGSGYISAKERFRRKPREVRAVRGPLTRELLLSQGVECPEVYGDTALLFSKYYRPEVSARYRLGIVPHFRDKGNPWLEKMAAQPGVRIVDITSGLFEVPDQVCSCERIASSSLHGMICADAYGIPSTWVKLSEKLKGGEFKFRDYLSSIGRKADPHKIAALPQRYGKAASGL